MLAAGLFIGGVLTSVLLTGLFRYYALANRLLDIPNHRSSHAVATPRGGGVAIVLTTIGTLLLLGAGGVLAWRTVTAFAGAGLMVASLGFLDDRSHIAPRWRLLGHFGAAGWFLTLTGGAPPFVVFALVVPGIIGQFLGALFLVWLINLTNFMDGIDGIAAGETITVCTGGCLLYAVAAPGVVQYSLVPLVLSAATLGFLFWNWPPAKIFMGDSGSGFLGLFLAALALEAGWVAPRLFWAWVVLLGVFAADATVTLFRRVARREAFYQAHRSHAYQHAAQRHGHLRVTLAVVAINVGWLLPIAMLVARGSVDGALGVLMAYLPLILAAVYLRAGAVPAPAVVEQ